MAAQYRFGRSPLRNSLIAGRFNSMLDRYRVSTLEEFVWRGNASRKPVTGGEAIYHQFGGIQSVPVTSVFWFDSYAVQHKKIKSVGLKH